MTSRSMVLVLLLTLVLVNLGSLKGEGTTSICGIGIVAIGDTPSPNVPGHWGEDIVQDHITIQKLIPEGQASKSGLQKGDEITQVNDRKVAGMKFKDVIGLIRGEEGTTVKVTIKRNGQSVPLSFTVTRSPVN